MDTKEYWEIIASFYKSAGITVVLGLLVNIIRYIDVDEALLQRLIVSHPVRIEFVILWPS